MHWLEGVGPSFLFSDINSVDPEPSADRKRTGGEEATGLPRPVWAKNSISRQGVVFFTSLLDILCSFLIPYSIASI
jgi:hypothetical protein